MYRLLEVFFSSENFIIIKVIINHKKYNILYNIETKNFEELKKHTLNNIIRNDDKFDKEYRNIIISYLIDIDKFIDYPDIYSNNFFYHNEKVFYSTKINNEFLLIDVKKIPSLSYINDKFLIYSIIKNYKNFTTRYNLINL